MNPLFSIYSMPDTVVAISPIVMKRNFESFPEGLPSEASAEEGREFMIRSSSPDRIITKFPPRSLRLRGERGFNGAHSDHKGQANQYDYLTLQFNLDGNGTD